MMLGPHDYRQLRLPLLALCASLAVLLYLLGARHEPDRLQQLEAQQKALAQASQRYREAGSEKETIVKYLPAYRRLIAQGFIGEEQRARWISDLRDINRRHRLFGIRYDIGAQQDADGWFALDPGRFGLHRSTMKLSLPLLHEQDLLTLLQALQNHGAGPAFMLRDCVIERIPGTDVGKSLPTLNAVCELDWLTLTEPATQGAP